MTTAVYLPERGRSRGDTPPETGGMSDDSEDEFETGGPPKPQVSCVGLCR